MVGYNVDDVRWDCENYHDLDYRGFQRHVTEVFDEHHVPRGDRRELRAGITESWRVNKEMNWKWDHEW